jgi:hypothetical protein
MALTSTIVIDKVANTAEVQITSIDLIEDITYTFSSNSLGFLPQVLYTITAEEYIQFVSILTAFNLAIITNFSAIPFLFSTFEVTSISDTNDGIDTLKFLFEKTPDLLYDLTAIYPAGDVSFAKREQATTLTFEEWTYYLLTSLHFNQEVAKQFRL